MSKAKGRSVSGLEGERICIRRTTRADLCHLARWWADPAVMAPVLRPNGIRMTPDEQDRWFRLWCADTGGSRGHYMVFDERDRPIGEICYHDLDDAHRRAWIEFKIGQTRLWGKGYAGDAVHTFCKYMFETLGIEELAIEVASGNERALAFWQKMGFVSYARNTNSINMRLRAETFRMRMPGSFFPKK